VIEEESNEKKHKKITIYSHSPMHREKITLGEMEGTKNKREKKPCPLYIFHVFIKTS
jgi:hypothetical protein